MAKNKFYEFKNQTETHADLYFYGDIADDSWSSFWDDETQYPANVKTLLDEANGKDLNIYINSGGGHVFGGMAIYNMLKRYEGYKTVYVDGLAGSIASVIALAGDKVVIPKTAYMMIHKPMSGQWGNANELRQLAETLDRIEEGIINVYAENLKKDVDIETIKGMVEAETWLTGEKAAEYFNIEVTETQAVACSSDCFKNYINTPKTLVEEKKHHKENKTHAEKNNTEKETLLMELDLI